jgi:hypothetical protein
MTIQKFVGEIASILDQLDIPYAVSGGLALSVWGNPRHTADVDIVVEIQSTSKTKELISELKKAMPGAYVDEDLAMDAFKRKSEFNIIEPEYGLKADFFVSAGTEFAKEEISRSKVRKIDGQDIKFVSSEDLIISKLLWFKDSQSTRHLEDISSVLDVQKNIDLKYIENWVVKLDLEAEWQKIKTPSSKF